MGSDGADEMNARRPPAAIHAREASFAGRLVWWLCYAVAAAVLGGLVVFADAWWMRGAIVLVAAISVIRIVRAERELREKFRGHCRACGYDVYIDDPWCPHCGGSVKELRQDLSTKGR